MLGLDLCRDPVHICVVKHTPSEHGVPLRVGQGAEQKYASGITGTAGLLRLLKGAVWCGGLSGWWVADEQCEHGLCLPVLVGAMAPASVGDQAPVLAGVDQQP